MSALWLAGVTSATTIGLVAVHLVGNDVGDPIAAPLTDNAIQQALRSVPPTAAVPTATDGPTGQGSPAATSSREGRLRTVSTSGGVVSARCRDGAPSLLYATPSDGYRTERTSTSETTVVRFVGTTRRVTLTLSCREEDLRTDARTETLVTTRPAGPTTSGPTPTEDSRTPEPVNSPEPGSSSDG